MDVLICTGDRDALQLVNDHVTVLYPRRGVSDLTRFTPEEVEAKYGLTPAQYPDFAALRGDPSDNLPGIPGVGEKTAAKWVREYGSLDALVEQRRHGQGQGRRRAARAPGRRACATGSSPSWSATSPLDVDRRRRCARQPWDREQVHTLFDNLQFRVLRERLFATLTAAEPEAEEGFDVATTRLGVGRGRAVARRARARRPARRRRVPGHVGPRHRVADRASRSPPPTARRPTSSPDQLSPSTTTQPLAAWLADPSVPKAVHDVKGPVLALRQHGWTLAGRHERHPARRLPARCPTSARSTWPTSRCATCTASCAANVEESGQLTLDGGLDESDDALAEVETVRATAISDLADALDAELDERRRDAAAGRAWSCR